jgi:ubiquitin-like 1-activating enzyme E1 A
MQGLAAEVCKNIVLAGIRQLTVLDDKPVSGLEVGAKFLLLPNDIGRNRAEACITQLKELNPMVVMTADKSNVDNKPASFFAQFDVICLTTASADTMERVSRICHEGGIKFFCGDTWGYFGYFFIDLGGATHCFVEEKTKKQKTNNEETKVVQKEMTFVSLSTALNFEAGKYLNVKHLPRLYLLLQVFLSFHESRGHYPHSASTDDVDDLIAVKRNLFNKWNLDQSLLPDCFASQSLSELSPVCAVVGGVLGQEVVKAVSGRDHPLDNFFFYDGVQGSGVVHHFPL